MAKPPSPIVVKRQAAASSIQWPEKTAVLFNPEPAARRLITRPALMLAVSLAACMILFSRHGLLDNWARASEADQMRPSMEAAMQAGNRTAGTWLAVTFPKEHPGLLEAESTAGEPTAMYAVGLILLGSHGRTLLKLAPDLSDEQIKKQGRDLIMKAANAGNQFALKYAAQHDWLLR